MVKYHISPDTGRPNLCRAELRACPVGGANEHYATKEEARQAYEVKMDQMTDHLKSVQKDIANRRENVVSLDEHRAGTDSETFEALKERMGFEEAFNELPRYNFTASDLKLLENVGAGKKVSSSKLDEFLEEHKHMEKRGPYDAAIHTEAARRVLAVVRAVRAKDPTPNTLPTLTTFDPATQTMFSNAQARRSAVVAGRAVRREAAHAEWMYQLAGEMEENARSIADEHTSAEQYMNEAKKNREAAVKSEARVQAQLRELQYIHDTDSTFSANMEIKRLLMKGWFRPQHTSYDDVPLGSVKKVK